jgi:hypothetical protein
LSDQYLSSHTTHIAALAEPGYFCSNSPMQVIISLDQFSTSKFEVETVVQLVANELNRTKINRRVILLKPTFSAISPLLKTSECLHNPLTDYILNTYASTSSNSDDSQSVRPSTAIWVTSKLIPNRWRSPISGIFQFGGMRDSGIARK